MYRPLKANRLDPVKVRGRSVAGQRSFTPRSGWPCTIIVHALQGSHVSWCGKKSPVQLRAPDKIDSRNVSNIHPFVSLTDLLVPQAERPG